MGRDKSAVTIVPDLAAALGSDVAELFRPAGKAKRKKRTGAAGARYADDPMSTGTPVAQGHVMAKGKAKR